MVDNINNLEDYISTSSLIITAMIITTIIGMIVTILHIIFGEKPKQNFFWDFQNVQEIKNACE